MTAYSGGEQIQNYLDPNRPDYGGIVLATSESGSALKRALMKLSADVAGAELMADAGIKAAKMGAAGIVDRANAGTFARGAQTFGQVVGAGISAIPTGGGGAAPMKEASGWSGGDTTGVNYDDLLTMSGDSDYANTIMNGGAMEWSSDW